VKDSGMNGMVYEKENGHFNAKGCESRLLQYKNPWSLALAKGVRCQVSGVRDKQLEELTPDT